MTAMRVVDLSFPIGPHFRWTVASERRSTHEAGANFQSTVLTVSCHAYTHVDAPVHFLPGERDIASMPVDQWMGPAAVVDLTHLGENAEVTAADLERRAGHMRRATSCSCARIGQRAAMSSERFWKDAPYTGLAPAVVARGVKAVSCDYARLLHPHLDLLARHPDRARGVHHAPRLLSEGHHRDRVPDQPGPDRRAALPDHRPAPQGDGRRRLAGARDRPGGLTTIASTKGSPWT
jgi:kynurenine formamidase